ncbi:MAG: hypothetical protein L6Q99_14490 [Planctomycetes bacterium]|nr:hypothetical protein [Planctomycetota bacterium]
MTQIVRSTTAAFPERPTATESVRLGEFKVELAFVLAATVALQVVAWSLQHGYPLADVVEYLERGRSWLVGGSAGSDGTIRSFAFPALFTPFFALDRWFGSDDPRWILPAARLVQMAFGLGFVLAVARLGACFGGKRVALAAAWIAAANPVFLLHSVWPLADVAAAACLATGLCAFVARRPPREAFVGGLWCGLGFLFAYKTLPVILLVGAWCVARDRWRHRNVVLGFAAGFGIALCAQIALDKWIYGEWGATVWRYFVENAGSAITTAFMRLDMVDTARAVYRVQAELAEFSMHATEPSTKQLMSKTWYFEHLFEFLSPPVLVLIGLGVWRAVRSRFGAAFLLLAFVIVHVVLTSFKGDKSFRLWMPILPAFAVLAALGFDALLAASSRWPRRLGTALVVAALALTPWGLEQQTPRRYGAFWDAMELVNEVARDRPLRSGRKFRVGSSFFWGPYLRNEPTSELVRVWPPLDRFARLGPAAKKAMLEVLDSLDVLMVHTAVLDAEPELAVLAAERWRVIGAFYEPQGGVKPGPLLVLARPRAELPGEPLLESEPVADPQAYAALRGFGESREFVASVGEHEERLVLLGVEAQPLARSTERLLVYHWFAAESPDRTWRVSSALGAAGAELGAAAARHDVRELVWRPGRADTVSRGVVLRETRLEWGAADAPSAEVAVGLELVLPDGASLRATCRGAADPFAARTRLLVREARH